MDLTFFVVIFAHSGVNLI